MNKTTQAASETKAVAAPAASPQKPKANRPTPDQLGKIHKGGGYRINPTTGAQERVREPTKPARRGVK